MVSRTSAVFLEPVDVSQHLDKLELYLGQVCRIAGISKMQLDYWTNKAHIPTKGRKQRIYDLDALETVLLIKQGKDKGLNLAAAIEAAQHFQAERRRSVEPESEEPLVAQEAERSLEAASSGASVLT